MSKMSELFIDIEEMLNERVHPVRIAKILNVPLGMVYDTLENMEPEPEEGNTEVFNPYNTVNS